MSSNWGIVLLIRVILLLEYCFLRKMLVATVHNRLPLSKIILLLRRSGGKSELEQFVRRSALLGENIVSNSCINGRVR